LLKQKKSIGEGYAGEVVLCKRKDDCGPEGKVYAAKKIKGHAHWTIKNEIDTLSITNHKNVVKLYDVFD
jgi:serine/threonine protein kinase